MNCCNSNEREWEGQGRRKEKMGGQWREREEEAIRAMKRNSQTELHHAIKERQRHQNPLYLG